MLVSVFTVATVVAFGLALTRGLDGAGGFAGFAGLPAALGSLRGGNFLIDGLFFMEGPLVACRGAGAGDGTGTTAGMLVDSFDTAGPADDAIVCIAAPFSFFSEAFISSERETFLRTALLPDAGVVAGADAIGAGADEDDGRGELEIIVAAGIGAFLVLYSCTFALALRSNAASDARKELFLSLLALISTLSSCASPFLAFSAMISTPFIASIKETLGLIFGEKSEAHSSSPTSAE